MIGLLKGVILQKVTRKADDSININFVTSLEQTSDQLKELDDLRKSDGIMYFCPNSKEISKDLIKEIDSVEQSKPKSKSMSQRLRNVIYRLHEQSDSKLTFNDYYNNKMETIIEHLKGQLHD